MARGASIERDHFNGWPSGWPFLFVVLGYKQCLYPLAGSFKKCEYFSKTDLYRYTKCRHRKEDQSHRIAEDEKDVISGDTFDRTHQIPNRGVFSRHALCRGSRFATTFPRPAPPKTGAGTATVTRVLAEHINEGAADGDVVSGSALRSRVQYNEGKVKCGNSANKPSQTLAQHVPVSKNEQISQDQQPEAKQKDTSKTPFNMRTGEQMTEGYRHYLSPGILCR